jgi:hypothetical protein
MKREKTDKKNTILAILLAATLTASGGVIGVGIAMFDDGEEQQPKQKVVAIEDEEPIFEEPRFDYGPWNDLNDYFDYNAVGMLDRERYCFRTTELCVNKHKWRTSTLDENEEIAYVYATPALCIHSRAHSTNYSTMLNGLKLGARLKVLERLPDNWAKVEYLDGETEKPVKEPLVGYVSMEYITHQKMYNIMKRHILPTADDEARFKVSKWRRAASDIIYIVGATPQGPQMKVTIENVKTIARNQESVVVFGLTRSDSDIKLLAFVEFYASDNEYRILGIIPGENVSSDDIAFLNTGDYNIKYSTAKGETK